MRMRKIREAAIIGARNNNLHSNNKCKQKFQPARELLFFASSAFLAFV